MANCAGAEAERRVARAAEGEQPVGPVVHPGHALAEEGGGDGGRRRAGWRRSWRRVLLRCGGRRNRKARIRLALRRRRASLPAMQTARGHARRPRHRPARRPPGRRHPAPAAGAHPPSRRRRWTSSRCMSATRRSCWQRRAGRAGRGRPGPTSATAPSPTEAAMRAPCRRLRRARTTRWPGRSARIVTGTADGWLTLMEIQPRPRRYRDRQHLVLAAHAADARGDGGDVPADAPCDGRPRLPAPGLEVQRAERALAPRRRRGWASPRKARCATIWW